MSGPCKLAAPRKAKGLDELLPAPAPAPAPAPVPVGYGRTIPDDPPPRFVAVPTKVPLNTDRAIGCALGVIVILPMIIWGAPTDGNTVVEGPPVIAPGSADADGVDCWGYSQLHKLIWYRMGDFVETKA